jgi:hypothetical protein
LHVNKAANLKKSGLSVGLIRPGRLFWLMSLLKKAD